MNKEQLATLRNFAEMATPGPWTIDWDEGVADFISSINPSVVLQLLDYIEGLLNYIEELEKDVARYKWLSEYLASDDTSHDDVIDAACTCVEKLNSVIDTAIQGETE